MKFYIIRLLYLLRLINPLSKTLIRALVEDRDQIELLTVKQPFTNIHTYIRKLHRQTFIQQPLSMAKPYQVGLSDALKAEDIPGLASIFGQKAVAFELSDLRTVMSHSGSQLVVVQNVNKRLKLHFLIIMTTNSQAYLLSSLEMKICQAMVSIIFSFSSSPFQLRQQCVRAPLYSFRAQSYRCRLERHMPRLQSSLATSKGLRLARVAVLDLMVTKTQKAFWKFLNFRWLCPQRLAIKSSFLERSVLRQILSQSPSKSQAASQNRASLSSSSPKAVLILTTSQALVYQLMSWQAFSIALKLSQPFWISLRFIALQQQYYTRFPKDQSYWQMPISSSQVVIADQQFFWLIWISPFFYSRLSSNVLRSPSGRCSSLLRSARDSSILQRDSSSLFF